MVSYPKLRSSSRRAKPICLLTLRFATFSRCKAVVRLTTCSSIVPTSKMLSTMPPSVGIVVVGVVVVVVGAVVVVAAEEDMVFRGPGSVVDAMMNDDVLCLHCMCIMHALAPRVKNQYHTYNTTLVGFGCFACFAGKILGRNPP